MRNPLILLALLACFVASTTMAVPMSQTQTAPDPEVTAKLEEYDRTRSPNSLREAADAAALHDGQAAPDAGAGPALGRQRVAGWLAIVGRIERDLPPGFDPANKPTISVAPPPSASGAQLPPGVDPRNVADPAARQAYIAAIQANRERLASFDRDAKLHQARASVLERAAASIADARQTLGLDPAEIQAMVTEAALTPGDRAALISPPH